MDEEGELRERARERGWCCCVSVFPWRIYCLLKFPDRATSLETHTQTHTLTLLLLWDRFRIAIFFLFLFPPQRRLCVRQKSVTSRSSSYNNISGVGFFCICVNTNYTYVPFSLCYCLMHKIVYKKSFKRALTCNNIWYGSKVSRSTC